MISITVFLTIGKNGKMYVNNGFILKCVLLLFINNRRDLKLFNWAEVHEVHKSYSMVKKKKRKVERNVVIFFIISNFDGNREKSQYFKTFFFF